MNLATPVSSKSQTNLAMWILSLHLGYETEA